VRSLCDTCSLAFASVAFTMSPQMRVQAVQLLRSDVTGPPQVSIHSRLQPSRAFHVLLLLPEDAAGTRNVLSLCSCCQAGTLHVLRHDSSSPSWAVAKLSTCLATSHAVFYDAEHLAALLKLPPTDKQQSRLALFPYAELPFETGDLKQPLLGLPRLPLVAPDPNAISQFPHVEAVGRLAVMGPPRALGAVAAGRRVLIFDFVEDQEAEPSQNEATAAAFADDA
jgi:hypothetical protein